MSLFTFFCLYCLTLCTQAEQRSVEDICKHIKACDEDAYEEMSKPGPLVPEVVFDKMKKYSAAMDELIKCLHTDRDGTYAIAKDIIDKKGAKFVQDIPWSWKLAKLTWGWDGRIIQDFLNYRMEIMETWMDVEKYFDPTAFIPKEMYTESYEESVKKVS